MQYLSSVLPAMQSLRKQIAKQDRCRGSCSFQRHGVFRWIEPFMTKRCMFRQEVRLHYVIRNECFIIMSCSYPLYMYKFQDKPEKEKRDSLLMTYPLRRIHFPTCFRKMTYCPIEWGERTGKKWVEFSELKWRTVNCTV